MARGCLIALPGQDQDHTTISYAEDVAPILQQKCQHCHRPGGIGPWAMAGYDVVSGWAPMMREVLRTRRMPPWHADPHTGTFSNDLSLTRAERQTLVHWIEAGAPRGDGADPLKASLAEAPMERRNPLAGRHLRRLRARCGGRGLPRRHGPVPARRIEPPVPVALHDDRPPRGGCEQAGAALR